MKARDARSPRPWPRWSRPRQYAVPAPEAEHLRSQHGEDRLLWEVFRSQPDGTYLEVGAFDGVTLSNTYFLDRALGWTGVLVEPMPHHADAARSSRPGSAVFEAAAVSPAEAGRTLEFEIVRGYEELSSLSLQSRYRSMIASINEGAQRSLSTETISVASRTLDDILTEADVSSVDFVSLDIEGHELDALKGFSLGSRWRPHLVLIEETARLPEWALMRLLASAGYGYVGRTVINSWYAPVGRARCNLGLVHSYVDRLLHLARRAPSWLRRKIVAGLG